MAAARAVGLHAIIMRLPLHYHSVLDARANVVDNSNARVLLTRVANTAAECDFGPREAMPHDTGGAIAPAPPMPTPVPTSVPDGTNRGNAAATRTLKKTISAVPAPDATHPSGAADAVQNAASAGSVRLSEAECSLLALARLEYARAAERKRLDRIGAAWQRKHAPRPLGAVPDFAARHAAWAAALCATKASQRRCGDRGRRVTVAQPFAAAERALGSGVVRSLRRKGRQMDRDARVVEWMESSMAPSGVAEARAAAATSDALQWDSSAAAEVGITARSCASVTGQSETGAAEGRGSERWQGRPLFTPVPRPQPCRRHGWPRAEDSLHIARVSSHGNGTGRQHSSMELLPPAYTQLAGHVPPGDRASNNDQHAHGGQAAERGSMHVSLDDLFVMP